MDPHNFIARAEALRWIGIAEKLLLTHDLVGSRTFAIRARETDPRLETPDQILTIADTLLAAEKRVITNNGSHQPDYYAILHLPQFDQNTEHITDQYRRLAVILNPNQNRFPYSEQAFQLVNDAWAVLSNPMRKSIYDNDLNLPQMNSNNLGFDIEQHNFFTVNNIVSHEKQNLYQHNFMNQNNIPVRENEMFREQEQMFQPLQQTAQPPQQPQQPMQPPVGPPQPPFSWQQETIERNQVNSNNGVREEEAEVGNETFDEDLDVDEDDLPTFWTACPYCLYMFEYPKVYVNCTLRCDNCKRASQAVRVKSPPAILEGQEAYFCCWGFFPIGVSMTNLQKNENKGNANSKWNPFSPLCDVSSSVKDRLTEKARPKKNVRNSGPWTYIDDETDDIFTGVSEPSDDSDLEWNSTKKKKAK